MTKRDLAALACKLLAVYFFIKNFSLVLIALSGVVMSLIQASQTVFGWQIVLMSVINLIGPVVLLVIVYFLWFKADNCAQRLFPEDSAPTVLATDSGFMPVALALTGVIVLTVVLPHLLSLFAVYLKTPETFYHVPKYELARNRIDVATTIIQVLVGIWLVFGAGKISPIIKTIISATINATQDQQD